MKKNKIFSVLAALAFCGTMSAQNLNSAYFLDGYTFGHQLNPAKDYDRKGYVSFPLLGNINTSLNGNLSATDIFKHNGSKLTTFLHPSIPMEQAMSGFADNNHTRFGLRMDILGFGFKAWGGFNTFNITLRSNVGANLPYGMMEAVKELSNKNYDISGLSIDAMSWVELGLGHSRQVTDAWRVGGKVKVLFGAEHAKVKINQGQLNLSAPDRWTLVADAEAQMSVKGFTWGEMEQKEYSDGTRYEQINFDNIDVESPGLGGIGVAFDLGAEWDLGEQGWLEGMTVSASLLDLGFISWSETHKASNKGKEVIINGFNDIQIDGGPGTPMEDQTDSYSDRFSDLIALEDDGMVKTNSMLGATLNVGVEYEMPFYDKLSVGLLSTTRFQGEYTWNEERISATVSPLKWLEASVNVGFGTLGTSFGWVANIHPKGFNLFVGMDHTIGKVSKQHIPLGSNTGVTMGINFTF